MIQLNNTSNTNEPIDLSGDHLWQDTLNLLKLMQNDFQGARRQLEQVNLHLAEREALVNQRLQHAFLASGGYNTLCLVKYTIGNSINQMGNAVLGGVSRPTKVPVPTQIEVRCLGRFEVRSAFGKIEHWQSAKAKSIFQYLLIRPHEPTLKDALIEALWPGGTVQAASNNLKAAVHSLRSSLSGLIADMENQQIVLFPKGATG